MGLFDGLRSFADISRGKWLSPLRNSTWINVGNLYLGSDYISVSYSKESLIKMGHDGTLIIFKSEDLVKLKKFYFGSIINSNKNQVRVMRIRTENLMDKFVDEKLFKTSECLDINLIKLPNLKPHL